MPPQSNVKPDRSIAAHQPLATQFALGYKSTPADLSARHPAQALVHLSRVVRRQDTNEQLVRWRRRLAARMPERTARKLVAPDASEQKPSRECATNATRLIANMQIPQRRQTHLGGFKSVPSSSNDYRAFVAHQGMSRHPVSVLPAGTMR